MQENNKVELSVEQEFKIAQFRHMVCTIREYYGRELDKRLKAMDKVTLFPPLDKEREEYINNLVEQEISKGNLWGMYRLAWDSIGASLR